MSGIGFEADACTAHVIIYGGKCPDSPKKTMDNLMNTLNLQQQPEIEVYAAQVK